ncbi:MAG: DUF7501 family protein [Methanobacteriota archaeon]
MREPKCEFCGAPLPDLMLGFLEHIDENPVCRWVWTEWTQSVRREAGGT